MVALRRCGICLGPGDEDGDRRLPGKKQEIHKLFCGLLIEGMHLQDLLFPRVIEQRPGRGAQPAHLRQDLQVFPQLGGRPSAAEKHHLPRCLCLPYRCHALRRDLFIRCEQCPVHIKSDRSVAHLWSSVDPYLYHVCGGQSPPIFCSFPVRRLTGSPASPSSFVYFLSS